MTPYIAEGDITMSDYFCGAGGSTSGAEQVPGVRVRIAVNHWSLAIETHNTNHPDTDHDQADMSAVDPSRYPRTVIGWFSPECTYWSQARGEKLPDGQIEFDFGDRLPDEAAERSRMTMWDVPRFAEHHRYEVVVVENVPRVVKGAHWPWWLDAMHKLGYLHEVVWLNSMHAAGYGAPAPQSRDRVYIVFWKAGNRRPDFDKWLRPDAVCPEHGVVRSVQMMKQGGSPMKTYKAQYTLRCPHSSCHHAEVFPALVGADSIIDWSLRGTRIADRKSLGMDELAEKTMLRTFAGARRHWLPLIIEAAGNTYDAADPAHPQFEDLEAYFRAWPADEPLRTLHATASKALVVRGEGNETPAKSARAPLGAVTAAGSQFLVEGPDALLVPVEGRENVSARSAAAPMRTQSTRNETALVVPLRTNGTAAPAGEPLKTVVAGTVSQSLVVPLRNHGTAKPVDEPIDTVSANGNHHALVMRNNTARGQTGQMTTPVTEPLRTLTTAGHQSLIDPGEPIERYGVSDAALWELVMDSEFRMLEPHEIKRGMAFAADYVLLGNKREQVRMAGNAVTPNAARDIIAAVVESLGVELERAA